MKWEYKLLKFNSTGWTGGKIDIIQIENELNLLGDDGWELVSTFDSNEAGGVSKHYVYNLKRKKD